MALLGLRSTPRAEAAKEVASGYAHVVSCLVMPEMVGRLAGDGGMQFLNRKNVAG